MLNHPQEADTPLGRLKVHVAFANKVHGVDVDCRSSCTFVTSNDLREILRLIDPEAARAVA